MITLLQSRCFVDDGRVISSKERGEKKCGDVSYFVGVSTQVSTHGGGGIFAGNVINALAMRRVMINMGGCL